MQSQSVLSQGVQDLSVMSKGDVSKTLFGQIQWEELSRSGVFLSHMEHQLLERAQANLDIALDNPKDAQDLTRILMTIAENCRTNLTVQQYVFTRIEEIMGLGIDFADADADAYGSKHGPLFTSDGITLIEGPFLKAMQSPDSYLQKSAALSFACLLTICRGNESALVSWVCGKLAAATAGSWELALPVLTMICRKESMRQVFIQEGGVGHVRSILRVLGTNGNAQTIYELVFILWTLSLGPNLDVSRFLHAGIIPLLVELISTGASRKVVRMGVAGLRNLAITGDADALTEMLTANVPRVLESILAGPKLAVDPEFDADVRGLNEILSANFRDLSAFDRWVSQVHAGSLRPGVVHQEKFWKENARLLESDNFKLLKDLIKLLKNDDVDTIKLALTDLGEFARYYPNGRGIVNSLGGKDTALELLSNPNPEVAAKALQCVSKIMVQNWEFMR